MEFKQLKLEEKIQYVTALINDKTPVSISDFFSSHSPVILEAITHHDRKVEVRKAPMGVNTTEEWISVDFHASLSERISNCKISINIDSINSIEPVKENQDGK